MCIAITGGAGYIGGHLAEYFASLGHQIVIIDNLSLKQPTPRYGLGCIYFENVDICESDSLDKVFSKYDIKAVIHCAGKLGIESSIMEPQKFYADNVIGSISLLSCMIRHGINKLIFSSSAALYQEQGEKDAIDENHDINATTPYARSKLYIEEIIKDYHTAGHIDAIIFRYFNIIGCGLNNCLANIYMKKGNLLTNLIKDNILNKVVKVYGKDYSTKDGTCIRDYVDIRDLISAHSMALTYLLNNNIQYKILNLCGNNGFSVIEFIRLTEKVLNISYDIEYLPRRKGDHPILIGSNSKAHDMLGWQPTYSLEETITMTINNLKQMKLKRFL